MGQFRDISIKSAVSEINNSYFLPDIQREYVWLNRPKDKSIELLFDSILRGYPIGSFLFWKLKRSDIETEKGIIDNPDKINFQLYKFIENYDIRTPHNIKVNIEQIDSNDLSIILDGQQRLTSLYIGLLGSRTLKRPYGRRENPNSFEEKKLYLNLKYVPSSDNPDDNYSFKFLKPAEVPNNDDSNFWFKVGNILEQESILRFSRENNLSDRDAETLENLKDAFCTKNLISYFEETEKDLDKVLKIFIRVNDGGTKLSYSDLLMSILTANFSSDIRELMNKLVDSISDKGFSMMGRDQILKTCFVLSDSNHIFNLKNFNRGNIRKIETNWDHIVEAIYDAVDIVTNLGYQSRLSSAYIITSLAYYKHVNQDLKNQDGDEIRKFVRNLQIKSYFTSTLDSKIDTVVKIIKDSNSFKDVNDKLEVSTSHPLKITTDDVQRMLDIQYGSPAALPVLQALYPDLDYKNSKFHIDHIYPKSKFSPNNSLCPESHRDRANYLYNLQLLEGDENRSKQAKDPSIWIQQEYSSIEDAISYKKRNYIDSSDKLEWSEIGNFEKIRSDLLSQKLRLIFDISDDIST